MAENLLLIGKTGHGKSSTGNSILGSETFVVSDFGDSETINVQEATVNRNGQALRVVDGPGLGDTRLDSVDAIRKACADTGTGIGLCPDGVHAFLLVLKYGNRFTQEEQETLASLRSILGPNVIRDFCVIVFTHGESFDMKNKKTGVSFPEWCQQQTGALGTVLAECGHRCVLFYNLDPDKMAAPMEELLRHVATIRQQSGCYTQAMFSAMAPQHQQLIVQANAPQLRQNFDSETHNLRMQLNNIQSSSDGFDSKLSQLASLLGQVQTAQQRATQEDSGTCVLSSQLQALSALGSDVTNQQSSVTSNKQAENLRREAERVRLETERVEEERRRNADQGNPCTVL